MQQSFDKVVRVVSFDGQTLWAANKTALYEVGNFLGGGAAGTVYEAEHVQTKEHVALKILNPLGYKLLSSALLRRCTIISKGKPYSDASTICKDNIWWLMNNNTKQYIAAYYSEKQNCLVELSLSQCMQVWGLDPAGVGASSGEEAIAARTGALHDGSKVFVPMVPPKYAEFVRLRGNIFREIHNMRKISNHINVICLKDVLELVQESKCTIFLVMELANGGELFDRIKIDCGTREDTAKIYFRQLLNGVLHCHDAGVCHRDLKPENLLLQDYASQESLLKIADFGFSARFAMAVQEEETVVPSNYSALRQGGESPMRILKSVVGSPFYVAPEVLQECGYDGTKADVWSMGVILYAMLAGNLPFAQDLASCQRFRHFCRWAREQRRRSPQYWQDEDLQFPEWLFPSRFSAQAKSLIVAMLHPDPQERISVNEAQYHPWCYSGERLDAPDQSQNALSASEQSNIEIDKVLEPEPKVSSFDAYCTSNDNEEIFHMEEDYNDAVNDRPPGRSLFTRTPSPHHPPTTPIELLHSVVPDDSILSARGEIRREAFDGADAVLSENFDYDFIHPPSFHDNVKRSTRFITSVPSTSVLETVESILNDCRINKVMSPMGMIGKVELHWESYSLDVWGIDTTGPPLCSLHIYQLPKSTPPSPASHLPYDALVPQTNLYLVDFVRGQVEIFVFKRFYEWVRQKVNELVKRDYTFRLFDQAGSPMVPSMMNRYPNSSYTRTSPLQSNDT